jgi:mannose-6-phosphate isomerase
MWHVLRAEPGAQIAAGFREPLTPAQLREASLSGEIENLLQWFDAAAGDTFYIPSGTVHAIGAGLTLCEIQQHSDITFRLYDYGRPRELHLDKGLEVSHLGPHSARTQSTPEGVLVSSPYFTSSKLCMSKFSKHIPPSNTPMFICVLDGSGMLDGHSTKAGEVWYLEAGVREIEFSGDAVLLQILS